MSGFMAALLKGAKVAGKVLKVGNEIYSFRRPDIVSKTPYVPPFAQRR